MVHGMGEMEEERGWRNESSWSETKRMDGRMNLSYVASKDKARRYSIQYHAEMAGRGVPIPYLDFGYVCPPYEEKDFVGMSVCTVHDEIIMCLRIRGSPPYTPNGAPHSGQ
jgi:hypothetical protein